MPQRLTIALLAINLCAARPYQAPARVVVESSSQCPSAEQVSEVLAPLLPTSAVDAGSASSREGVTPIHIHDSGDSFSVLAAGQQRVFEDAERSCAERARLAAVFAGLMLARPAEPAPTTPRAPAKPATLPPPPAQSSSRLELALILQAALGTETKELPLAGGLAARFVQGSTLALSLGAAAFLPMTLHFDLADARIVRAPVDVSVRLRSGSALEASGELGVFVGLLVASGERVPNAQSEVRPELGARAALLASLELSPSIATIFSLHGSFVPRPHEFELRPGERAGAMPAWWLGAALAIGLRP